MKVLNDKKITENNSKSQLKKEITWKQGNHLLSRLVVILMLIFIPLSAQAKKCNWVVNGQVLAKHILPELPTKSSLKNIEVKVSARTKLLGNWALYNSWGTVRTGDLGSFSISNEENCVNRQFRVKVKFQDADLEVRHEKATSSATKVKWYTIVEDQEYSSGTVNIGAKLFAAGGVHDLGLLEARRHADIWKLYKMAIDHMASMGSEFAFTTQVKVKHPNNSIFRKDDVEVSYANPTTKVIYIFENNFNTATLLHELGHILAYNHSSGEICLTIGAVETGTTHGLVDDSCVAFHEGFAEWWREQMETELFNTPSKLPFGRGFLSNSLKLTNVSMVQRHDTAWISIFRMLVLNNIHKYDFNASGSVTTILTNNFCSAPPGIGFKNVLKVFNEHTDKGHPEKLSRDETTVAVFLKRAGDILNKMTPEFRDMFEELVDPTLTSQPGDVLCKLKKDVKTTPITGKIN